MPYIQQQRREALARNESPENVGELTYVLTSIVTWYLSTRDLPPCYSDYAECVAALENSKLELYRRRIAPYEDEKIKQNGDVY